MTDYKHMTFADTTPGANRFLARMKPKRCYYCDKTNVDMVNRHGKWFCETCANDYDFGRFHTCESSEKGGAVDICEEYFDGSLWVSNSEYSTQVNYCPFCGYMSSVYIP